LNPKDLIMLSVAYNLANLLKAQGKLTEAEPLYQRALKGRIEVLGPKHPDTLSSVHNLTQLLKAQVQMAMYLRALGKLTEAELLYRRAIKGFEVLKAQFKGQE